MLFVESEELQLLVDPESADGKELRIGVVTATGGRRELQADSKDPDKLHRLPDCAPTADGR
ncbi:MAG: hypothetical protein JO106_14265 [Mycobacterium sp.]|nr:hypothetical protein [Mycobacterium sp.]